MEMLLLCRVVDNYGDIGFVYRLARALSALDSSLELALAVSDLASFSHIAPGLSPVLPFQRYRGWDVLDWNDAEAGAAWCRDHGVGVVLECFQCGRPGWLEDYLFGGGLPDGKLARIVNVEYLTAEGWAEDFHLLKGGTRSPRVKKVNFLPGFTARTGGLLQDRAFAACLADPAAADALLAPHVPGFDRSCPAFLVFSYERDWEPLLRAFGRRHAEGGRFSVCLAAGRGAASFLGAYGRLGCSFPVVRLGRLEQTVWDALLASCSLAFVRGEDSFSEACLSGRPFVWQAYRQAEGFHLVKVAALLERMRPFFPPASFSLLSELFLLYNMDNACGAPAGTPGGGLGGEAREAVARLCPALQDMAGEAGRAGRRLEELAFRFLSGREGLAPSFAAFAASLRANGDLAGRLLSYVREFCG